MSHDGHPKWTKERIEDMRKGAGGGTIGVEPKSEAQRVAEIERAAVEMERAGGKRCAVTGTYIGLREGPQEEEQR